MSDLDKTHALLKNSRLFKDFSPAILDTIEPLLVPCRFEADNMVCLKEDASDCLYLIEDGQAEVSVSSSDGRVILLGVLSTGDVFGEVGLLDKGPRTAHVTAKTDLSLYRLSSEDFDKMTALFGVKEWGALTSYICFLFRGVTNNLEDTIFLDAGVRIAKKILALHQQGSSTAEANGFSLSLSQESLGRMAGLSREATNKALSQLADQGLIKREYKKIVVPNLTEFSTHLKNTEL